MDEFQIFFCMFIDDDMRSIYRLSNSELTECDLDQIPSETVEFRSMANSTSDSYNVDPALCSFNTFHVNILSIKPFLDKIKSSNSYRNTLYYSCKSKVSRGKLLDHISPVTESNMYAVIIKSNLNQSYVIDYAWGWRLWRDSQIGIERECAAAWLSTLGGAFSALGDYSQKFASMAFYTSIQQIRLAKTCEDPNGVARGWLFLALALSQLGYDKFPKILLRRAWEHKSLDPRHRNMCLGVRAKLRYDAKLRRLARENNQKESYQVIEQKKVLWETFKSLTL